VVSLVKYSLVVSALTAGGLFHQAMLQVRIKLPSWLSRRIAGRRGAPAIGPAPAANTNPNAGFDDGAPGVAADAGPNGASDGAVAANPGLAADARPTAASDGALAAGPGVAADAGAGLAADTGSTAASDGAPDAGLLLAADAGPTQDLRGTPDAARGVGADAGPKTGSDGRGDAAPHADPDSGSLYIPLGTRCDPVLYKQMFGKSSFNVRTLVEIRPGNIRSRFDIAP
jgi:hypothetical protein